MNAGTVHERASSPESCGRGQREGEAKKTHLQQDEVRYGVHFETFTNLW